jgi:hypothetical protein
MPTVNQIEVVHPSLFHPYQVIVDNRGIVAPSLPAKAYCLLLPREFYRSSSILPYSAWPDGSSSHSNFSTEGESNTLVIAQ